jgi:hypothetical protein
MNDESDNKAATQKKNARELTVEDILNRNTYGSASKLKKGVNGVYVDEIYKGRDAGCVIRLSNPDVEILEKDCVDAVEIIKRELGNLPD